ncbi:ANTAR domain-containing protein [Actinomycetospora soli]|uniref:ANTAR domain-containing protein n=1 Tax=Actinomycetospora soli TaxID=2893887 RepID=UPI001E32E08C|nr:ANTAR domain-containing protein [Actinomycetospora soli]MCD2186923.1 ANTAR domain-containing protein [Actinomycetospora soli]
MHPRQNLLPPPDPTDVTAPTDPADPALVLARAASELNAGISDRDDALAATLTCITSLTERLAPLGRGCAGVLLCRRGRPETAGTADRFATELDALQVDLGQGPAVDVLGADGPVVVEVTDLATADDRWPAFAPAARARGVAALLAVALVPRDRPLGAVTLYVRGDGRLPAGAAATVAAIAVPAAMALHAARRVAGLDQAVTSRDLIGQAKGVLMQRDHIGPDEAFGRLVAASQHTNLKLVDVARWLVDDAVRG